MTVKQKAREVIDQLPDESSWDDVMYAIHLRQKIESGLADLDAGRKTSHPDVKRRFAAWSLSPES